MGKKNDKAPKAPDPKETAAAQTQMNIDTALAQNAINQVNQVTPDGSLTYAQTGTRMVNGRAIPVYTATTKLSEAQQNIKNQGDAAEFNLAKLANNQSAFLNDYMGKPVDLSTGNIENYMNTHFMDDFNKTWDQDRSSLETKLANSGIRIGSDAYTRAMSDFSNSRSSARDNLYGNQYDRALQSLLTERNQPLNEITALLSGSQVSQPNFVGTPQTNVAGVDYAGLVNQGYQNQLAAWQAKQQQQSGMLGGMFGLAGKLGAAAIMA